MRRLMIVLLSFLVVGLCGCKPQSIVPHDTLDDSVMSPATAVSSDGTKTKFSVDDKLFGVLTYGMSRQEVIAALGEPGTKDDGIQIGFNLLDGVPVLASVYCDRKGQEVIRGISIGSTKEEVLKAFYQDKNIDRQGKDENYYLYGDELSGVGYLTGDITEYAMVTIVKERKKKKVERIEYVYHVEETPETEPATVTLCVTLDSDDRVESIYWCNASSWS
jgi:outer membrane protein assembly factor BamE (lipoprotein component of BamABCDE complex)